MREMKILYIIEKISGGGRERRLVELIKGMSSSVNSEVHILTFSKKVDYKEVFNTKAILHICDSCDRNNIIRQLYKTIKMIRPEIVHSWMGGTTDLIVLPFLRLRYGFKYIAGFIANSNKVATWSVYNFAAQFSFCFADAIVSNSYAGLIAKKANNKKNAFVIYNGFDFSRFTENMDVEKKRNSLSLKTSFIVCMVARVSSAKDYDSFIELAKKSQSANLNVTFLAIGRGEKLEAYKNAVKEEKLSNIRFVGQRDDVEQILQISDVSVLFTNDNVHSEGVSNSIMEAMAAGLPVIATRGGGTNEIITSGKNGFIIEPGDVESAFKILNKLLLDTNYRKCIGNMARQEIKERFLLSDMTNDYLRLYQSLL